MTADAIKPTEAPPPNRFWRSLRRWVFALAVVYGGILVVLLLLENKLIFIPATQADSWIEPTDPRIEDVWLNIEGGARIHAWYAPVENPTWYLLYCHGNAGNLSHRRDILRRMQQSFNASIFIFDYPGYGRSDSSPSEAGCYAAAHASYQWLLEHRAQTADRIVIFGKSLGAAVAVETAVAEKHAALVLVSPFLSVPDMAQYQFPWLPGRWLCRNKFDNQARLADYRGPLFIAHGMRDSTIPIAHGRRLHDIAPAKVKKFVPLEGCDHNDSMCDPFYESAASFLRDLSPSSRQ